VTLDQLASVARLGKFRLLRAFERQVGMPPHRYLIHLRIRWAELLLSRGEAPSVVAARVGFVDQSHLTRRFKQIVGATPGAHARRGRTSSEST
jgi:AraC-like DNA-binding protein